jgi:chromosome partitioning protein
VAPTIVHNRVDFAASMIDGRTVMEIDPTCASAQEIAELWRYLHARLMRAEGGYRMAEANGQTVGGVSNQHRVFGRKAAQ